METSTRYILCTRTPGRHRKAVEVCRQCRHRAGCKDFHEADTPGLTRNLDKLQRAMDRLKSRPDVADRFKEELTAIRALC